jgi:phage terminase large subunit-like protein
VSVLTVPDDKGLWWPTLGPLVCGFMEENLVFGPGDRHGEPYELDEDKRAFVYRMYEIYPKDHPNAGRRRFKRCGLSLPKGTAKTEFGAIITICELHPEAPVRCDGFDKKGHPLGKPVEFPYIPLVAFTEEQSDELCYGDVKYIIENSSLALDFDIGLERIMRRKGDGKAESLSSSPEGRDGALTTFQVSDETHWWKSKRQKQAHKTMQANLVKRREADAWGLEITTAPEPGVGSIAEEAMEYAQAIKEGRAKNSRFFFFHRQADESHKLDTPEDIRAAVIEARGPAAAWSDIDAIVALFEDTSADRAFLDRVYCNRLVKSSLKAFDFTEWQSLVKKDYKPAAKALITLGFDGAMFDDSVGLVGTEVETGHQFVLGVWAKPYGKKAEWQVPVGEVDDAVTAAFDYYEVWRMYADPQYWDEHVAAWAGKYGKERVVAWYTNRWNQMCYAIEAFDTAIKGKTLSHDGNKTLGQHISNAFKKELAKRDEQGKRLWVIQKERPDSPNKIDLAMAGILSWRARLDAVALGVTRKSIYETQEVKSF